MAAINAYKRVQIPQRLPVYMQPQQHYESPVTAYGDIISLPSTTVKGQVSGVRIKGQTWTNLAGAGDTSPQTVENLDAAKTYLLINSEGANVTIDTVDTPTPVKLTGATSFDFGWASGEIALYELSTEEATLEASVLGQKYHYVSGTKSTVSAMRIRSVSEDESEESAAYVLAKDEDGNIVELRSLPNGTKDEIRVGEGKMVKRVSDVVVLESEDFDRLVSNVGENVDYIALIKNKIGIGHLPYIATSDGLGRVNVYGKNEVIWGKRTSISSVGSFALGSSELRFIVERGKYSELEEAIPDFVGTKLTYQLANPVISYFPPKEIPCYPSGTIYIEPKTWDVGLYNSGITIENEDIPIKSMDYLYKINTDNGALTPVSLDDVTIAGDGLSFTITGATDGEFYEYGYEYDRSLSTLPTTQYSTPLGVTLPIPLSGEQDMFEPVVLGRVHRLTV